MPQYELNIRDYIRIFRRRKVTIAVTFFIVLVGSIIHISRQPVTYQSSVTIKIEERKNIAGLLTEWIVYNPADVMESETRAIKGYPIMKKVALHLKLIDAQSPIEQVNTIVSNLQGSILTEKVGNTNMIRIIATSSKPKEAMDLANAVAEVYIDENLAEKAKQARHTRQFIEEQLTTLENRLKQAEEQLRTFGDEVRNIKLAGPIQEKLVDLEFQLAELLQKYTEKHPRIIQLKDQMKTMESQLQGFSGKELEYSRLTREVEVNKKLYSLLKEKLEEARITEAQKVEDVSIVDPAIFPGAPVAGNKNMLLMAGALMGIILGFALAFIFETLDTSISTIEDVESVVKLPVLGLIPPIETELQRKQNFLWQLKERFLPTAKTDAEERFTRLVAHFQPKSPTSEAFRNIHTNLKLSSSRKTILVTSSGPREGKSSFVSNLGIVMAQTGLKTLLVSADLRRPILAKTFGIAKEPGLNELLTGTASLDDVLKNITDMMMGDIGFDELRKTPGIENVWIIPSGKLPFNPPELLEAKVITELLEKLRARFDVVIFDTPPVLPVTDASLLAPLMDCVVIVYEMGRTSREALLRVKVQLESVGATIAGIILNHTRTQTEAISTYPYYYHKYKYYGSDEATENNGKNKKENTV